MAYLRCRVGPPSKRLETDLVLDYLSGPDASALIGAGYPASAGGVVEGIRLDEIEECHFEVMGRYGGNNALHLLAVEDITQIANAGTIPPDALSEPAGAPAARTHVRAIEVPARTPPACIDRLEIHAEHNERVFDAYAMIDWSASSHPVTGNDSIWVASGTWLDCDFTADAPVNVSTRHEAVKYLRRKITDWQQNGKRVLVGFDFAFGYPAGFAAALGLATAGRAWKAVHSHIAASVADTARNGAQQRCVRRSMQPNHRRSWSFLGLSQERRQ